jgi:hypothetical protein
MNSAFFSNSRGKFSMNTVNHRGWAWVSLCLVLAVHVFDEAMTDFLSVYNPTVQAIRQKFQFFETKIRRNVFGLSRQDAPLDSPLQQFGRTIGTMRLAAVVNVRMRSSCL